MTADWCKYFWCLTSNLGAICLSVATLWTRKSLIVSLWFKWSLKTFRRRVMPFYTPPVRSRTCAYNRNFSDCVRTNQCIITSGFFVSLLMTVTLKGWRNDPDSGIDKRTKVRGWLTHDQDENLRLCVVLMTAGLRTLVCVIQSARGHAARKQIRQHQLL